LIVPHRSDLFFTAWLAQVYYKILLKAGVKIYEYRPRVLHAKTSLIDDWCTLGSSNLNFRSFVNDLELDVVLASPTALAQMEEQFARDMEQSVRIESLQDLPLWKRILARLLFKARRWL
jgi:cardiolipin synthase